MGVIPSHIKSVQVSLQQKMKIRELLEGMLEINETTYANVGDIFDHIFFQEKKRLYRTNKHDWNSSLKAVKKYFEIKEKNYQKIKQEKNKE